MVGHLRALFRGSLGHVLIRHRRPRGHAIRGWSLPFRRSFQGQLPEKAASGALHQLLQGETQSESLRGRTRLFVSFRDVGWQKRGNLECQSVNIPAGMRNG